MPSLASTFPVGFSWLSAAAHPSQEEIDSYAEFIAEQEGLAPDQTARCRREAELQLWVWRSELQGPRRRRRALGRPAAAAG